MGCQKEIATKIISRSGDFLLAVKDNQPNLYQDIKAGFDSALETDFAGLEFSVARTEGDRPGAIRNCGNAT